jgi:hypothetical protein
VRGGRIGTDPVGLACEGVTGSGACGSGTAGARVIRGSRVHGHMVTAIALPFEGLVEIEEEAKRWPQDRF